MLDFWVISHTYKISVLLLQIKIKNFFLLLQQTMAFVETVWKTLLKAACSTDAHYIKVWVFSTLTILTGKNCFIQFSARMAAWLLRPFFKCLNNQLRSINSIIMHVLRVEMLEKCDSSISKNEWLPLSASFTAKFGLVFVLTLKNVFS